MERKGHVFITSSSKALNMVILFTFCLNVLSSHCLDRTRKPISGGGAPPLASPTFKARFRKISLSIALGTVTGLIFALLFALLVRYFVKYISRTPLLRSPVLFAPKISTKVLKSALSSNSQLLGSSLSGKYYRAVLDNGLVVAVKKLEPLTDCSVQNKAMRRKTEQELEVLSHLRHRNLMSLRAYVFECGGYCLVYDYVSSGSLEDVMRRVRENQLQLKWEFRHRIAVGIVKGLHYLHFSCDPKRLHYNLKPSNVILDSVFEPRLADCGVASILPNFCRAASGYNAPECFQSCRYEVLSFDF